MVENKLPNPIKTKQPTKAEFITEIMQFSGEIMMALADNKVSKDEAINLVKSLLNRMCKLYGVNFKIVKEMPPIKSEIETIEGMENNEPYIS